MPMMKINGKDHSFALQNSSGVWTIFGSFLPHRENDVTYVIDTKSYAELTNGYVPINGPAYASTIDFMDNSGKVNHKTKSFTMVKDLIKAVNDLYDYALDLSGKDSYQNGLKDKILSAILNWPDGEEFDFIVDNIKDDITENIENYLN